MRKFQVRWWMVVGPADNWPVPDWPESPNGPRPMHPVKLLSILNGLTEPVPEEVVEE